MAVGQLVQQFLEHRDVLLGFIFALTRDYDVSEDIFQAVAMAILEEDRRDTSVGNFMAWAREIARRRVSEHYRKLARREAIERPTDAMTEVIAQAFAENEPALTRHRLRLQALLECLERLSGRSREVIDGFYGRRMSLRALAAALGWQENSVKVALSRARKALADCIKTRLRLGEAT